MPVQIVSAPLSRYRLENVAQGSACPPKNKLTHCGRCFYWVEGGLFFVVDPFWEKDEIGRVFIRDNSEYVFARNNECVVGDR